jgi:hypothetical protein
VEEEVQLVAAVVVAAAFAWAWWATGLGHWVELVGLVIAAVVEISWVTASDEWTRVVNGRNVVEVHVLLVWATSATWDAVITLLLAAVALGFTRETILGLAPDVSWHKLAALLISVALVIA